MDRGSRGASAGTNDSSLLLTGSINLLIDGATVDDFAEYLQPEPEEAGPPEFVETKTQLVVDPGTTDGFSYPLSAGEPVLVASGSRDATPTARSR